MAMHITVQTGEIAQLLAEVTRSSSSKDGVSTDNVRVVATPGRVDLACSNLGRYVSNGLTAQVHDTGYAIVNARMLAGFVGRLPREGLTTFRVDETNDRLYVTGDGAVSYFPLGDEFVAFPDGARRAFATYDGQTFARGVNRAMVTIPGKDCPHGILYGVHLMTGQDAYTIATSDGLRLGAHYGDMPAGQAELSPEQAELILPHDAMREVARMVDDRKGNAFVRLGQCGAYIAMQVVPADSESNTPDAEVLVQPYVGRYPAWPKLMAMEDKDGNVLEILTTVKFSTKSFLQALNAANVLANDAESRLIRLRVVESVAAEDASESNATLMITAITDAGATTAMLDCYMEGEDNAIALNSAFLRDLLKAVGDEESVEMEMVGPKNAVRFSTDGQDYQHLVMPLFAENLEVTVIPEQGDFAPAPDELDSEMETESESEEFGESNDWQGPSDYELEQIVREEEPVAV